jgi:hypothetical protein
LQIADKVHEKVLDDLLKVLRHTYNVETNYYYRGHADKNSQGFNTVVDNSQDFSKVDKNGHFFKFDEFSITIYLPENFSSYEWIGLDENKTLEGIKEPTPILDGLKQLSVPYNKIINGSLKPYAEMIKGEVYSFRKIDITSIF